MKTDVFRWHTKQDPDFDIAVGFADILTAFDKVVIGSKVLDETNFLIQVATAINKFDWWSACREPGQAYIQLPKEVCAFVSSGVGKRSKDPDDYVIHTYRDEVKLYLKRNIIVTYGELISHLDGGKLDKKPFLRTIKKTLASPVENVAVIVYTLDAYLRDPDCSKEEHKRVLDLKCTHILVAILASANEPSTLTPHRFIHNLAGGNNEALLWTADEIRQKAKEIKEFSSEWCVVADEESSSK